MIIRSFGPREVWLNEARWNPRTEKLWAPPIGPEVVPFWGLPSRILNTNHEKELLGGLWVANREALIPQSPQALNPQLHHKRLHPNP